LNAQKAHQQQPSRHLNQRNQYRMVSMSLGNNSKNKVSAQNYRTSYNNGLNQTQGQRVISSITGQPTSVQNKIPTYKTQKGKHAVSKSITDSAAVKANMGNVLGLSQTIRHN